MRVCTHVCAKVKRDTLIRNSIQTSKHVHQQTLWSRCCNCLWLCCFLRDLLRNVRWKERHRPCHDLSRTRTYELAFENFRLKFYVAIEDSCATSCETSVEKRDTVRVTTLQTFAQKNSPRSFQQEGGSERCRLHVAIEEIIVPVT